MIVAATTLHPEYLRACEDMLNWHLNTAEMADKIADVLQRKYGGKFWRVHRSRNVANCHNDCARYIQIYVMKIKDA